ncbi:MAG: hypothetical protein QS748_02210 [Candidatus Endonucleobacter bathymodioli]|uniref:Uncharacterized protein n=1 Tax=Candidatus Endonucleibacter bathymodioli TaxID=539814 RepID=A0AA90NRR2_9GAMM|nr:hypothetical protein [Candidatus Endonucleobacter bathymodioli]
MLDALPRDALHGVAHYEHNATLYLNLWKIRCNSEMEAFLSIATGNKNII